MAGYYCAAKYRLGVAPIDQWRDLSDLSMVVVELVRLARVLGRPLSHVEACFEEAAGSAAYEWDDYELEKDE